MTPRPFVEEIARDLPPGRALDLACGDGRNAIWLAERGWRVTAVDRAPAIQDSLDPAIRARVDVHAADLEQDPFPIAPHSWDLILMSYYLQPSLFDAVVAGLKPGGVAILIVHLFEPGHEASRFSLRDDELRRAFEKYSNLSVVEYREIKPAQGRKVAQLAARARC